MSDITIREKTLTKAISCVCGDRERDYGTPEDNFGTIARLWTVYLDTAIAPVDVAMMMALLKVARIKNGGGTGDSFVDLAGYAACGAEIFEKEAEMEREGQRAAEFFMRETSEAKKDSPKIGEGFSARLKVKPQDGVSEITDAAGGNQP